MKINVDQDVVNDFGEEWNFYKQNNKKNNLEDSFNQYFDLLPKKYLNKNFVGFDAGCGSGRWAKYIAPKVKKLYCFDPSEKALDIAKENLSKFGNCIFECCDINSSSIKEESMDFGYCLGVLHHIPDTKKALLGCISKLKKGAPLIIYVYYNFDNKPMWFKLIWKVSDFFRRIICLLPFKLKLFLSKLIAIFVYFPLARGAYIFELLGFNVSNFPLSDYRKKSFYFMCTDSLDRFGTKLEKRFSRLEIKKLMIESGLEMISFSNNTPFHVALGFKK